MHRWASPIQAVVLYVPRQPEHWRGGTADSRGINSTKASIADSLQEEYWPESP